MKLRINQILFIFLLNLFLFPVYALFQINFFNFDNIHILKIIPIILFLFTNSFFFFFPSFEQSTVLVSPKKILIFLIIFFLFLLYRFTLEPYGMWDSWALWNFKAKIISLNYLHNKEINLFSAEWLQSGYPLFIPLQITFFSVVFGEFSEYFSLFLNFVYGFLFLLALSSMNPNGRSWIAKNRFIAFISYQFWIQGSDLCADFNLSITFALCFMFVTQKTVTSFYGFLIGIMAGILPHIKDEGMLLAIAIIIIFMTSKSVISSKVQFIFGFSILLIPLILFKLKVNKISSVELVYSEIIWKLLNLERYLNVLKAVLFFGFLNLPLIIYIIIGLFKFNGLFSKERLILGFLVIIYLGIFIVTNHNQLWHLQTAFVRVMFQLVPAFLILILRIDSQFEILKDRSLQLNG